MLRCPNWKVCNKEIDCEHKNSHIKNLGCNNENISCPKCKEISYISKNHCGECGSKLICPNCIEHL